jgi:hypothetical protein
MTLAEIMQKIEELSAGDRAVLRRELEEMVPRKDVEEVTPEMRAEIQRECAASDDERGMPIEDVVRDPNPKS